LESDCWQVREGGAITGLPPTPFQTDAGTPSLPADDDIVGNGMPKM